MTDRTWVDKTDKMVADPELSDESITGGNSSENPDGSGNLNALWKGDRGVLAASARKTLLKLIRGPFIEASANSDDWNALLTHQNAISARLNEMFLELVIDVDRGVAFARNVQGADEPLPKAARMQPLTVTDTVMILTLRRELLTDTAPRIIIGRDELFASLSQYRPIEELDEAAFRKRLDKSWTHMVNAGILRPLPNQDRAEISPVLSLVFGAEQVKLVNESFDEMLRTKSKPDDSEANADTQAEYELEEGEA